MKPVDQARISYKDGDCLRACIASVLELPLGDVPDYSRGDMGDRYAKWLGRFNLTLMTVALRPDVSLPDCYHLVEGPSRNGKDVHVAVGRNGEIVHDPDPTSRGQFKGDGNYWVFVAINPAEMVSPVGKGT